MLSLLVASAGFAGSAPLAAPTCPRFMSPVMQYGDSGVRTAGGAYGDSGVRRERYGGPGGHGPGRYGGQQGPRGYGGGRQGMGGYGGEQGYGPPGMGGGPGMGGEGGPYGGQGGYEQGGYGGQRGGMRGGMGGQRGYGGSYGGQNAFSGRRGMPIGRVDAQCSACLGMPTSWSQLGAALLACRRAGRCLIHGWLGMSCMSLLYCMPSG